MNFNAGNAVKIKETLELTTFILGSELGSHLLLDRLKILSSKDMLTGVLNRNEMNILVDKLSKDESLDGQSVGVVFADLNGLKTMNDQQGHVAGDELLKKAANILTGIFGKENVYRAGGDEFSIIMLGASEGDLNQKVLAVREQAAKTDDVSFALGSSVQASKKDIRVAVRKADENMYEDKKRFYEANPGKKMR